ncbi:hypothetical protein [Aquimarina longa]|uniref:hypothetical protein n=1 Tax=Aquimarina longa TaxID=1080221 RepID=UPI000781C483|nr:hypothetical protein [Aquimarina longa]
MNITTINADIREAIKTIPPVQPDKITTPKIVETTGFLLETHYTNIQDFCTKNNVIVTFRNSGAHTLERIKNGNPCKGHDVMDKSIKEKGTGYTYKIDATQFNTLKGLVGVKGTVNPAPQPPNLAGLWTLQDGKSTKTPIDASLDLGLGFTGDYDMHDLLKDKTRLLATTPDERSLISNLSFALLKDDPRTAKTSEFSGRIQDAPYSCIRHGAQTSFLSYLLANQAEIKKGAEGDLLPYENSILNIDTNLCGITPDGAYIMDSIEKIYTFYANYTILSEIPVYYFFKYVRSVPGLQVKIDQYTEYINNLLN